jgi:hypothetical protein
VQRMHPEAEELFKPPRAPETSLFPDGLHNAFLFAVFNALSFQLVLGSPMVLYPQELCASQGAHSGAPTFPLVTGLSGLAIAKQKMPSAKKACLTSLPAS